MLLVLCLPMFFEGGKGIFGGLFILAGGLICFPPTRRFFERKYNFAPSKLTKYALVVWAWLSIGIFSKPVEQQIKPETVAINASKDTDVANKVAASVPMVTEKRVQSSTQQRLLTSTPSSSDMQAHTTDSTTKTIVVAPRKTTVNRVTIKSSGSRRGLGGRGGYMWGPRGGCYYMAGNSKVYVDHSFCR